MHCILTVLIISKMCIRDSVQGVRGAGEWNLGWGQHTATQELADAFEEGDPRKDETLLYFIRNGRCV